MRILQLQLCVLICCGAAVSDLVTDLGSDVIINCDLDENDVYWIFLKTPDPPTVILRSFSTTTSPFYTNKTLKKKYSVQFKHRLVINNVTADELGVYYCMDTERQPKYSNSTRIYYNEQINRMCHNQTTTENSEHKHAAVEFTNRNERRWQIIMIISGVMNGILAIVLIGLVKVFVIGKRRTSERSQQLSTDLQQTQVIEQQGPDQLQYAEVDFTKLRKNQVNNTYAAINPPMP